MKCKTPQDIVKEIVDTYGENIFCEKNRFLNLLSDYMAGDVKSKRILSNAIKENIPQKLYDIRQLNARDREINIIKIKKYYRDDNGLEEATASFSVNCFAYALDWNIKEVYTSGNTKAPENQAANRVKKSSGKNENLNNNKIINMTSSVLTKEDVEKYLKENKIIHPFAFTVPDGCKKIDDKAFKDCKLLKSIIIPNGVEYIGEYAFMNCKALVSVNIPAGVRRIGTYAFWGCKVLDNIVLPNSIRIIEKGTFDSCTKLKKITIPNSVVKIEECAFQYCAYMIQIALPGSVAEIGDDAFNGCSTSLTIIMPNSVKKIGQNAFGFANVSCNKDSYCARYCKQNNLLYKLV